MARVNDCHFYQVLSIHPDDRWLLGMFWEDALYVDAMLPLGMRSALKIFTKVTNVVEWSTKQEGWIAFLTTWMWINQRVRSVTTC